MEYKDNLENDSALAAAFTLAGEMEENTEVPEEKIEFSAEHEAKMKKLFEAEYKRQRRKQFAKYASRAAAIFVSAVLVAGVSIGSVEAWRVRVINFFRETTEEYTEIKFTEEPVSSYSVNGITLNYIPEGYRLVEDSSEIGKSVMLCFQNADGKSITFRVKKVVPNSIIRIDTEDGIVTEFEYRGHKAIKSIKDRVQILVWYDDEIKYSLNCEISEEELMKIADNIDF